MRTASAQSLSKELLDNPVWASLSGNHRCFAVGSNGVKRYPRTIAPFVAVGSTAAIRGPELIEWIDQDEEVYIVGVIPETMQGVQLLSHNSVLQMVCSEPIAVNESGPKIVPLGEESVPEMQALTTLVYPRFFRAQTHKLGRYFGIWQDGRLAAMAGERISMENYREISGVCTHPDFQRRGYSKLLITRVVNGTLAEGNLPFLHVDIENEKAIGLYRSLGFVNANVVPMVLVRRTGIEPGLSG